jgi:NAD(P)-dependent dehydrogenase (short-subunit alcohol dehydrogenase family)
MPGRVDRKVALVVGGGQTPGQSVGNGRATAIVLAREGAEVIVADRNLASAEETVQMIRAEGHMSFASEVDASVDEDVRALILTIVERHGRLDILHNNIGASISLGDAPATEMTEDAFDRSFAVNLKCTWLTCKHALPVLRRQGGSIVNISSLAAVQAYPLIGYKTMKAAVIAFPANLAAANARYGVRANCILPGLMNTPMAIEHRVAQGSPREQVVEARDRQIPLGRKMGTGWDTANAALFLHSEEARSITGVALPVDGRMLASYGD